MLVLTRKRSEMIQIGDDVVIKVIRTGRGSVKLGIEAPGHVRVLRAELCGKSPEFSTAAEAGEEDEDEQFALSVSDQYPVPGAF